MNSMLISYGIQNVIERLMPLITPLHSSDVLSILSNSINLRTYNMFIISYKYVI